MQLRETLQPQELKASSGQTLHEREHEEVSLGSDLRGTGDDGVVCVQKYLSDCWNMNLFFFFVHFQLASVLTLNVCNIASSLILLPFHLLHVFHLFLIYIYILFSGFFFSFLTLQNERQNDGQLTIYIIIFPLIIIRFLLAWS